MANTWIAFLCSMMALVPFVALSQSQTDIAQATEFSIPSSGAFNLLGVNPATVSRPGFTKDFKLDNFARDGKLLDNIAMEAQPFWVLLFKNKDINSYQEQHVLLRTLSNINVSLGTAKQNNIRQFAWSGKLTLRHDPMMNKEYIASIDALTIAEGFNDKKMAMAIAIDGLKTQLRNATTDEEKENLQKQIEIKQSELSAFHVQIQDSVSSKMKLLAQKYIEDHWTDPVLDIGAGEVYRYNTPTLDSIDFSTKGFGLWLNPACGFKLKETSQHKIQLAALLKWLQFDAKKDLYAGVNIRYGTSKINAFLEFVYGSTDAKITNTLGYGLTYKIDNKKVIEVGLKQVLDKNMTLKNFYPAISFNWALAKDILK